MEILWLSLVAIPVLALIALWEHRFSKGEWLKDKTEEPIDKVEFSEEAHQILEEQLKDR
jgi:hypothetical protein